MLSLPRCPHCTLATASGFTKPRGFLYLWFRALSIPPAIHAAQTRSGDLKEDRGYMTHGYQPLDDWEDMRGLMASRPGSATGQHRITDTCRRWPQRGAQPASLRLRRRVATLPVSASNARRHFTNGIDSNLGIQSHVWTQDGPALIPGGAGARSPWNCLLC